MFRLTTTLKHSGQGLLMLLLTAAVLLTSCKSNKKQETKVKNPNLHEVVVKQVLQVTQYTYLLVTENDKEHWLAAPKTEARAGETYYYENGMLMTNFASKDLGRTFESITFVDRLSKEPIPAPGEANTSAGGGNQPPPVQAMPDQGQAAPAAPVKPKIEKADVKVEPAKGGVTVAQLYARRNSFENRTVKVRGQVTRVNNGIMGRNWVHIQDGTSYEGNVDLTVTTDGEFRTGDVVTFEGKISLKKDFGYGYFYEVIMEEGKAK